MNNGPNFYRMLEDYLKKLDPPKSFYKVSKATGQSTGHYSSWKHGRFGPSDNDLRKLAAISWLGLTFDELAFMRHQAKYGLPPPESFEKIEGLYKIPVLGTISAGPLSTLHKLDEVTDYVDWYDLSMVSSDLFALRVQGDSMWPPIPNGAIVICRKVEEIKPGQIYVIETDDGNGTLKAFRFNGTQGELVPLNPNHQPISPQDVTIRNIFKVLEYKVNLEETN